MDEGGPESEQADSHLEAQLHIDAWEGLARADLLPLVRLFRSGFVLNEYLARDIADAIEGTSADCRITARMSRAGRPGNDREATALRNGKIAAFVAERSGRSAYEAAVREAMEVFGLSRTSVTDAVRAARDYREGLPDKLHAFWDDRCEAALAAQLRRARE